MRLDDTRFITIFFSLIWLFLLYLLISAVLKHPVTPHPVYYISVVFGMINAYIVHWMDGRREKIVANHKRLGIVIISIVMLLMLVSLGLSWSGDKIVKLIGSGYFFWFFFSTTGLIMYSGIKKWRSSKNTS
jgi:uncharacterized membrane protein